MTAEEQRLDVLAVDLKESQRPRTDECHLPNR